MTNAVRAPLVLIELEATSDVRFEEAGKIAVMRNLGGILVNTTSRVTESDETPVSAWITPEGGLGIDGSLGVRETARDICTVLKWCSQTSTRSNAEIGVLPSDALASLRDTLRTAADFGLICRIYAPGIAFEPASMRDMHESARRLASISETRESVTGRIMFYKPYCRFICLFMWGRDPEIVWLTLPVASRVRDVEFSGQYISAELIRRSIPDSDPVYTIDRFAILGSRSGRNPKNLVGAFSRGIRDFFRGRTK